MERFHSALPHRSESSLNTAAEAEIKKKEEDE